MSGSVNLGEAAEYMFDHNIFQENLVGVDYCEKMVSETNPGVLAKAENAPSRRTPTPTATRTIADIMRSLNPFTGEFYREALQVSRWTREMFCLMEGRHVHPSTLYPGGIGTDGHRAAVDRLPDRGSMRYVEFMKKVVPMHDDLFDFFYEALPGYDEVGLRRTLLGCWGSFQDPEVLQLRLQGHGRTGAARCSSRRAWWSTASWSPPTWWTSTWASGSCWAARTTTTGPTRRCSSRTIRWATRSTAATRGTSTPSPTRRSGTWTTSTAGSMSPRWFDGKDHLALDTGGGPLARLWSTALAGLVDIGYVKATGSSVQINLPKTALKGPVEFEWKIPRWQQRHRAQPRPHLLPGLRGRLRPAFRREGARRDPRRPDAKTWEKFEVPDEGIGCGFTEAVRGVLSHHMVIRDGKIANYHPLPADTVERQSAGQLRHPRPVRRRRAGPADLRGERPGALQGHRHHAHGAQLRPVSALRRAHVPGRRQDAGPAALPHPIRQPGNDICRPPHRQSRIVPEDDAMARGVGERIQNLLDASAAAAVLRARDRAEQLVREVTDLYGAGLDRMLRTATTADPGLAEAFAGDDLIASLLLVHGLHPHPVERRIADALDEVRPLPRLATAADVHLLEVDGEVVRLSSPEAARAARPRR